MQTQTNTYDDWLDLTDSRSRTLEHGTEVTPTTDINAAFDQVAALFDTYPTPDPPKNEKMTSTKKNGKRGHTKKK